MICGDNLNICNWTVLEDSSNWYTNSLINTCEIRTSLSTDGAAACFFYGSCYVHERRTSRSAANSCSVKLPHLDWVDWFDIHTPILGLIFVAFLSRDECVVVANVLTKYSQTVASHV